MSIYDDGIEKAIEALKAYNEKRNSTPTPKREPLTVNVLVNKCSGEIELVLKSSIVDFGWDNLGEFVLQPKEQTP